MSASQKRKKPVSRKRKKSIRKKRTSITKYIIFKTGKVRSSKKKKFVSKKRKIQKEVVGKIIFESGVTRRLKTYRVQEYERTLKRKNDKRKYLRGKKLSKENQKLYRYIKKYKSSVAKKYKRELTKVMVKKGYFVHEIHWARYYSIIGLGVERARVKVAARITKSTSKLKQAQMYKRAIKAARIKGYMDVLGVSKKKAQQILKIFEKHLPGEFVLKALIY